MTTLSVPVSGAQLEFVKSYVKKGQAENIAQVVRKGLDALAREEAIQSVLRSEQDIREGKVFSGDIDELVKKLA